ncbi:MAG TPA: hypothetical protein PLD46_09090, partial [Hyphomicrobium sp.]|nr:hypothetical protein [Hyphomicrobium sp.]
SAVAEPAGSAGLSLFGERDPAVNGCRYKSCLYATRSHDVLQGLRLTSGPAPLAGTPEAGRLRT